MDDALRYHSENAQLAGPVHSVAPTEIVQRDVGESGQPRTNTYFCVYAAAFSFSRLQVVISATQGALGSRRDSRRHPGCLESCEGEIAMELVVFFVLLVLVGILANAFGVDSRETERAMYRERDQGFIFP